MSVTLERWLRLQPGEGTLVLLFGGLMMANALAMQVAYVASLSGFLKADGLQVIWIVWLVDYGIFLLIAAAQTLVIDRYDRVTLMRALLVGFTVAFAGVWLALQLGASGLWVYGALYLVAEQQWMLFPLFYWVLASDAMGVAQAKRLFPLMASWGLVGKLVGLAIAAAAPTLLARFGIDLGHLLLLNVVMYLLSFGLLRRLRRRLDVEPLVRAAEGFRAALTGGIEFIRDVPTFRHLAVALLALMFVDTLVEFRFLAATDAAFTSQASYQAFYGSYRIVLVTLAYGIQALVTQRLLARMPLRQVLSLQPYVGLTVLVTMLALPGVGSAVGALFLFRLVGETFHDSAKKALQGLVPEERRGRVSLLLESVVISLGTIGGALLIGAVTTASDGGARFDPTPVYLVVALIAAVVAVFAARRMRRTYEVSLLSWRLARRQRTGASLLDKLL
jgi:ATP:ADP antiporter, AAA family